MQWVIFFALSQLAPPLLRWQWRLTFSLFSAAVSLAMIGAVLIMEWLSPYSSSLIVSWVAACTALVLLNVKTVDILAHKAEVLTRLRTRLRSRRLPVRIEVRRR